MSTVSYRPFYGLILSLATAILWGALPIFLKITLQVMDGQTVTFYRFAAAAMIVGCFLALQGRLPSLTQIRQRRLGVLLIAAAGLTVNYVLNLFGLMYVNPETTQVVTQLAPFMLMLGSLIFHGERFGRRESFGAIILFAGLLVFFNDKLVYLMAPDNDYSLGVWFIVIAAIAWSAYALLQKQLLQQYSAKQLTLLIYVFGAISLLPLSTLSQLSMMNNFQWFALFFCCLNTVFAYGAFTEALNVWQASKVSAILATTPIFTFVFMEVAVWLYPNMFESSDLNMWAYVGACLVVIGSVITALRGAPSDAPKEQLEN